MRPRAGVKTPVLVRALRWLRRRRASEARINRGYRAWLRAGGEAAGPAQVPAGARLISILMPVHDTAPAMLAAAIASVRAQIYPHWQLCIADDGSRAPHIAPMLMEAAQDVRVVYTRLAHSGGIAAATNAALALARGEWVALLDHDDVLSADALSCVAAEIEAHPDAGLVFSDEDLLIEGARAAPYFKPGWDIELLYGQNLVSHLGVYRTDLVRQAGGLRGDFDGSQDYDLALRVARLAAQGGQAVRHIPRVLYHWRRTRGSFSARSADRCAQAARGAIADHLAQIGEAARVVPHTALPYWHRVVHDLADPPLLSVIGGAARDAEYRAIEWATLAEARGEILLFLSPSLRPAGDGWAREMVSQARRAVVGCVGGKLCTPNGRPIGAAGRGDPGYRGILMLTHCRDTLSPDCLAIRRDLFEQLGAPDAALLPRLARDAGLRNIWTPFAQFRYASGRMPDFIPDPTNPNLVATRTGPALRPVR